MLVCCKAEWCARRQMFDVLFDMFHVCCCFHCCLRKVPRLGVVRLRLRISIMLRLGALQYVDVSVEGSEGG